MMGSGDPLAPLSRQRVHCERPEKVDHRRVLNPKKTLAREQFPAASVKGTGGLGREPLAGP